MSIGRRTVIVGASGLVAGSAAAASGGAGMYGLVGRMTSRSGQRAALIQILVRGLSDMPGCLSYVVAEDPSEPDLIWITEVWETKEAHAASLGLPSVRAAITEGRPLIAGMERVAETVPVGGHGLVRG